MDLLLLFFVFVGIFAILVGLILWVVVHLCQIKEVLSNKNAAEKFINSLRARKIPPIKWLIFRIYIPCFFFTASVCVLIYTLASLIE